MASDGFVNYLKLRLSSHPAAMRTRYRDWEAVPVELYCHYMNPVLLSGIQGHIRRGCVHAAAVFLLLLPAAGHASPIDQQVLVDQLRTDYAAMVSAEHEYRVQRERSALNEREAVEYAAYVARLFRRVAGSTETLEQAARAKGVRHYQSSGGAALLGGGV